MIIGIIRIAVLAAIIWAGWKTGIYLMQAMSSQKRCGYCEGKGYWIGTREKEFCKKCNGTGLIEK